jgi:hypothetical protein
MRVFNDSENNRVTFLDERYYQDNEGNYFPSVTTVLDAYPKGKRFEQWLKDSGNAADDIVERAATQGTNVHSAIEALLKGAQINFADFTLEEWKMILRFKDFYNQCSPVMVGVEVNLVSPTLGVGGTIDIICIINGERWLLDNKTSGDIYDNHYVQLATYAMMWNEAFPNERIDRIGALHLRARTKGAARDGKVMQGAGWKIEEPEESPAELFEIFKHVKVLWHRLNPHEKPLNIVMPASVKLDDIKVYAEKKTDIKVRQKVAMPFE